MWEANTFPFFEKQVKRIVVQEIEKCLREGRTGSVGLAEVNYDM